MQNILNTSLNNNKNNVNTNQDNEHTDTEVLKASRKELVRSIKLFLSQIRIKGNMVRGKQLEVMSIEKGEALERELYALYTQLNEAIAELQTHTRSLKRDREIISLVGISAQCGYKLIALIMSIKMYRDLGDIIDAIKSTMEKGEDSGSDESRQF